MPAVSVRAPALVCASLLVFACGSPSSTREEERALVPIASVDATDRSPTREAVDAGAGDPRAEEEPAPTTCSTSPEDVASVAQTFVSPHDALALSLRNDDALLSWVGYRDGARMVTSTWMASDGSAIASIEVCRESQQLEPASAATERGFVSVWSDDPDQSFELYAQAVRAEGERGAPVRLTDDAVDDRSATLATGQDGNVLLVWQSLGETVRGHSLLLAPTGKPFGRARELPALGATVGRPVHAALGAGYVLAWIDAASRHVLLQRLDDIGAPVGEPLRADAEGDAEGHLALATSDAGGALAFDVRVGGIRGEVRFRAFATTGSLTGIERVLSTSEEAALWPSIAALRGGYAVSYRSERAGTRSLMLALVDARGERLSAVSLSPIVALDMPSALRVSPDGATMLAAFTDALEDMGAYALRRAWIHCD